MEFDVASGDFAHGDPRRVPEDIDPERPSPARIYDYVLGGAHNFEADRQVAESVLATYPEMKKAAYTNRAFLRRAVEFMVDAGIRQFLDIGSGVPTVGHVHEVAQAIAPESRVVFVDIDPVAVAHSRDILRGNDRTAAIQEDARRPEAILSNPETQQLLDLSRPVGVLVVALFHFIADADEPADIGARLTAPLASGSYLAIYISQVMRKTSDAQDLRAGQQIAQRAGLDLSPRTHRDVEALFAGFELVEPGLVWVPQWRPESPDDLYVDQPEMSGVYAGVGRKP